MVQDLLHLNAVGTRTLLRVPDLGLGLRVQSQDRSSMTD